MGFTTPSWWQDWLHITAITLPSPVCSTAANIMQQYQDCSMLQSCKLSCLDLCKVETFPPFTAFSKPAFSDYDWDILNILENDRQCIRWWQQPPAISLTVLQIECSQQFSHRGREVKVSDFTELSIDRGSIHWLHAVCCFLIIFLSHFTVILASSGCLQLAQWMFWDSLSIESWLPNSHSSAEITSLAGLNSLNQDLLSINMLLMIVRACCILLQACMPCTLLCQDEIDESVFMFCPLVPC